MPKKYGFSCMEVHYGRAELSYWQMVFNGVKNKKSHFVWFCTLFALSLQSEENMP